VSDELHEQQVEALLKPIHPGRVHEVQGMSHVEAYDIRAMLIRIFGFGGWSVTTLEPTTLLYEEETTTRKGDRAYKVAYKAAQRLLIHATNAVYDGTAVGEALMPDFKRGDAHDMAIKTAESQALKRCAINLGDGFGLSLYNNGSMQPLVRKVWVGGEYIVYSKEES
jgi:recombination DNA repair RAD52 pathway protein